MLEPCNINILFPKCVLCLQTSKYTDWGHTYPKTDFSTNLGRLPRFAEKSKMFKNTLEDLNYINFFLKNHCGLWQWLLLQQ